MRLTDDLLSTITASLRDNGVEHPVILAVVKDLKAAASEEKDSPGSASDSPTPKVKTQGVILLSDPYGKVKSLGDLTGWVVQIEDSASPAVTIDRIRAAAVSFNRTKAGRKHPVKTVGDALQAIRGKHWKDEAHPERRTKVVTREQVQVLTMAGPLNLTD